MTLCPYCGEPTRLLRHRNACLNRDCPVFDEDIGHQRSTPVPTFADPSLPYPPTESGAVRDSQPHRFGGTAQ